MTATAGAEGRGFRRRRITPQVAIADYGAGNLRSVVSAFRRAGAEPAITTDPKTTREARLVVVAGVGHAGSAAAGFDACRPRPRRSASAPPLRGRHWGSASACNCCSTRARRAGPVSALLPGRVVRLRAPRVPHMGWNTLQVTRETPLLAGLDGADVYFAHSFAGMPADDGVVAAVTDHGGPVVAAVATAAIAGVQFHPERSAAAGARVLANALAWSRSA